MEESIIDLSADKLNLTIDIGNNLSPTVILIKDINNSYIKYDSKYLEHYINNNIGITEIEFNLILSNGEIKTIDLIEEITSLDITNNPIKEIELNSNMKTIICDFGVKLTNIPNDCLVIYKFN